MTANTAAVPLDIVIDGDDDYVIVSARGASRELAREIGFGVVDQTRIATAVSEIVRNVVLYASRGMVRFVVHDGTAPTFRAWSEMAPLGGDAWQTGQRGADPTADAGGRDGAGAGAGERDGAGAGFGGRGGAAARGDAGGRDAEEGLFELSVRGKRGLEVVVNDEGPGIRNVEAALRGGYSTAGGFGRGISGARALVDEFRLESAPGVGTRVCMRKWLP